MQYKIGYYTYGERNKVILKPNTWDDFGYKTLFDVQYVNNSGVIEEIGGLKIAKNGMSIGGVVNFLPKEFCFLPKDFYSMWTAVDFYKKAREIMDMYGFNIFNDLNDVTYDVKELKKHKDEGAFRNSFLRFTSMHTCVNQFHRICHGEAILTPYSFEYSIKNNNEFFRDIILDFNVSPMSYPPTNLHALIGSNGTGKTTLIKDMIKGICGEQSNGKFSYGEKADEEYGYFESIMCISFSPFDDYSEVENLKGVSFIGFKKNYEHGGSLLESIENDFYNSYKECVENHAVKSDLKDILDYLIEVGEIANQVKFIKEMLDKPKLDEERDKNEIDLIKREFRKMSAGHKVTLSILTRCIANLAEKTIVFIDEPENHLHPPLLSTLIRSLSKILNKRNGVGIISTHSPIILQEIPRSCVWNLYRVNDTLCSERVENETFGSNIGVLTNSVFDFEITKTGFNSYLSEVVDTCDSYEEVMDKFNYQLGDQACSMVRILLSRKG